MNPTIESFSFFKKKKDLISGKAKSGKNLTQEQRNDFCSRVDDLKNLVYRHLSNDISTQNYIGEAVTVWNTIPYRELISSTTGLIPSILPTIIAGLLLPLSEKYRGIGVKTGTEIACISRYKRSGGFKTKNQDAAIYLDYIGKQKIGVMTYECKDAYIDSTMGEGAQQSSENSRAMFPEARSYVVTRTADLDMDLGKFTTLVNLTGEIRRSKILDVDTKMFESLYSDADHRLEEIARIGIESFKIPDHDTFCANKCALALYENARAQEIVYARLTNEFRERGAMRFDHLETNFEFRGAEATP